LVREIGPEFDGAVMWGEHLMTRGVRRGSTPAVSIGD
jgi:hypothetical protein